ncbi:MAG: C-GCAxxG-C-C family protein [Candidatus Thorarchaeota archaeon]|jgi:C_GCAxxG_C_C family probable redox protein
MSDATRLFDSASKMMPEMRGNCAQAIFTTYGVHMGLGKVDFDTCMKIASAFGGGINLTGNVCGAVTGALMALGLKFGGGPQEAEVAIVSTKFIDEFTSLNGSIICREIIGQDFDDLAGQDLPTEEDMQQAFDSDVFKKCMKCVDDAARLLNRYIE